MDSAAEETQIDSTAPPPPPPLPPQKWIGESSRINRQSRTPSPPPPPHIYRQSTTAPPPPPPPPGPPWRSQPSRTRFLFPPPPPAPPRLSPPRPAMNIEKWGTHIMGPPALPAAHPDNLKAAAEWRAEEDHRPPHYHKPDIIRRYDSWTRKAEDLAGDIWSHLNTKGLPSHAEMCEKLTTLGCYLSTATGPVAGALYLADTELVFCSDRPLLFTMPSGQGGWNYYSVRLHLEDIYLIEPVTVAHDLAEKKYIRIVMADSRRKIWMMGFYDRDRAIGELAALPIGGGY